MVQTSTSSSRSEDYDLQDVVMEDMRRAADYQQQLNSETESESGEEIDTMLKNDSEKRARVFGEESDDSDCDV